MGALLAEYGENGARFPLFLPGLNVDLSLKHFRRAIKLLGDGQSDLLSPLDLMYRASQRDFIDQSKPDFP